MRDIKFKFWLGHTKKMTYEHSLIDIAHLLWDFTEDTIPLQYTGLKDKNGVEIYEGDILKFGWPVNGADGEEEFIPLIVVIDFHGGAFWFKGGGYTDCNWHFYNSENREVIGNIHQHPSLLTQKQNQ